MGLGNVSYANGLCQVSKRAHLAVTAPALGPFHLSPSWAFHWALWRKRSQRETQNHEKSRL